MNKLTSAQIKAQILELQKQLIEAETKESQVKTKIKLKIPMKKHVAKIPLRKKSALEIALNKQKNKLKKSKTNKIQIYQKVKPFAITKEHLKDYDSFLHKEPTKFKNSHLSDVVDDEEPDTIPDLYDYAPNNIWENNPLEIVPKSYETDEISALGKHVKQYTIFANEATKTNMQQFFDDCQTLIETFLTNEKEKGKKNFKYQLEFVPLMVQLGTNGKPNGEEYLPVLNNKYSVITHVSQIPQSIIEALAYCKEKLAKAELRKSGWRFDSNVSMTINLVNYSPISALSYIPYASNFKGARACINIKNTDNKCFLWDLIAFLFPLPKTNKRQNDPMQYLAHLKDVDFTGIEFPIKICERVITKIEELNQLAINLFELNALGQVCPLLASKNVRKYGGHDKCMNLLVITEGEKRHFVLIKDLGMLLHGQVTKNDRKVYICPNCLEHKQDSKALNDHFDNCGQHESAIPILPPKGSPESIISFNKGKFKKMLRVPFRIYADFESMLMMLERLNGTITINGTKYSEEKLKGRYQSHQVFAYSFKVVCDYEQYSQPIQTYVGFDALDHFFKAIFEAQEKIMNVIHKEQVPISMSAEEECSFQKATCCNLCNESFSESDKKCRDHCHFTGKYRGATHNACNLNYHMKTKEYFTPVFFHNLKGYDSHFLIKAYDETKYINPRTKKSYPLEAIPQSDEKFIAFSIGNIRFLDSVAFTSASLDDLVKNLVKENNDAKFKNLKSHFKNIEKFTAMKKKGFCPYDYFNGMDKLKETKFPPISRCYNKLNKQHCSAEDYATALSVWKLFKCKTLQDYLVIYLQSDVLLLADAFENFREVCLQYYQLDPCHYYTTPGLAWDAFLKYSKAKIEVFNDEQYDMYLFVEKSIRGGISMISQRFSKANNKYMSDYNPKEVSKYLFYLDANNLYGWAMSQYLPVRNYEWEDDVAKWTEHRILNSHETSNEGAILEVDLVYPKSLHDAHNCYPLAVEHQSVEESQLSEHTKKIYKLNGKRHTPSKKLVPNLNDKHHYTIHIRNLKQCLQQGMKLSKVHKVLTFEQEPFLASYIAFNSKMRGEAGRTDFEKDFFKLMNNAVYGKTMENVRGRMDFKVVKDAKKSDKWTSKTNFKRFVPFNENSVGIFLTKKKINFYKPIIVGFSVLELSKLHMLDFHYNTMKPIYKDKIKLVMTDTDSFIYEIETEDLYQDILTHKIQDQFDFSDYPKDHPLYSTKNKKVIGMFKDECNGKIMNMIVALRSKMYAFDVEGKEKKVCKGVKRSVVKNEMYLEDYYNCLVTGENYEVDMNVIRSLNQNVFSMSQSKTGLSSGDDKRFSYNTTHTLAHGHYRIAEIQAETTQSL
jgi:hypothetical protein